MRRIFKKVYLVFIALGFALKLYAPTTPDIYQVSLPGAAVAASGVFVRRQEGVFNQPQVESMENNSPTNSDASPIPQLPAETLLTRFLYSLAWCCNHKIRCSLNGCCVGRLVCDCNCEFEVCGCCKNQ